MLHEKASIVKLSYICPERNSSTSRKYQQRKLYHHRNVYNRLIVKREACCKGLRPNQGKCYACSSLVREGHADRIESCINERSKTSITLKKMAFTQTYLTLFCNESRD
jgi:hypothetical protein